MAQISQATREKYLARRELELAECKVARTNEDFGPIQMIGHKMKGNGATFGFPEISDLGAKLEEAAKAQNWVDVDHLLAEISAWVKTKTQN